MFVFFLCITITMIIFEQIQIASKKQKRKSEAEKFCKRINDDFRQLKAIQYTNYK